jgi:hypothetical protein
LDGTPGESSRATGTGKKRWQPYRRIVREDGNEIGAFETEQQAIEYRNLYFSEPGDSQDSKFGEASAKEGMTVCNKLRAQEIESFSKYEEVDNAAT